MKLLLGIVSFVVVGALWAEPSAVRYQDYQLKQSSRRSENIEWMSTKVFNAQDRKSPRVFLIGDSICGGYHAKLRDKLGKSVNLACWYSSYCVTDPNYLPLLDAVLTTLPNCSMITLNNGLHSLNTNLAEWEEAYEKVVQYLLARCPQVRLSLVYSTPLKNEVMTVRCRRLNEIVGRIAKKYRLPVVDLFSPMDQLDRATNWTDAFHFRSGAYEQMAALLSSHIQEVLQVDGKGNLKQLSTETGPEGALR